MEPLLKEFPTHTYEQWREAAEALLKGAPFEKLLVSKTHEDITIQPIFRREDIAGLGERDDAPGSGSLVRASRPDGFLAAGWEVSQELTAESPAALNTLIHEGLNGGQSELNLGAPCQFKDAADIATALDGVALDAVSVWWRSGGLSPRIAADHLAAAEKLGCPPAKLRGGFQFDPVGKLVSTGRLSGSLANSLDAMAALTREMAEKAPALRTIAVDGTVYQNAGASATQELGYTIATLVTYIEEMKSRGLEPATVLPRVRLILAVGSDYFMELAKIRAARWLWSRVAEAYGVTNAPVHVHVVTSRWNKTAYDAHSNMLRVTSESFAAVVAGADSLHIGPYDEISGNSTEFSRRIARNLHTILREECGLDRVIDPAGGSFYIEWLTDQVAARSWAIFQDIENAGGMVEAIRSGAVQKAVETVRGAKLRNIRLRKERIVGSNMYPDLKGGKLEMEDSSGACSSDGEAETVAALGSVRAAEEYEALRDASAAYCAKNGAPPPILQLNIGPSRKYRLRADWTAAFFEAAGFAVDGKRDFDGVDDAVAALAGSPAAIAVITSDDPTYQEVVEPIAKAVKAAKPGITLLVAGAPGDNEAAWKAAGVDLFVNVRSNNYELNEQLLKTAGVL